MHKDDGVNVWKVTTVLFIVLFIISIGLGIYEYNSKEISCPEKECPKEEEKALVYTHFSDWGGELGNPNGYIFQYSVYNFGDVEAKDIIVKCIILDQDDNIVKTTTKNFGNLASNSGQYDEMYEDLSVNTIDYGGYCITKSCSNCEILERKIPELREYL